MCIRTFTKRELQMLDEPTLPAAPNPLRAARIREAREFADWLILGTAIGCAIVFVWAVLEACS